MSSENKEIEPELVSDCCGYSMDGLEIDYSLCPKCKEHCEAIDINGEEDE